MSVIATAIIVLAVAVVAGNAAILLAHVVARRRIPPSPAPWGSGAPNAHEVTDRLWRSGKPTPDTYRALASTGGAIVIDLRAEGGDGPPEESGLAHVRIPIRDGQPPRPEQIDEFLSTVRSSSGRVLVHCSAGVGRTGSMVSAWQTIERGRSSRDALRDALAVGPPSLEQIDFIRGLPRRRRPRPFLTAVSRLLDAPRRTLSQIRQALRG